MAMLSPSLSKQSEKPLKTASHLPAALTACTRYAAGGGDTGQRWRPARSPEACPPGPVRIAHPSVCSGIQARGAPGPKGNELWGPRTTELQALGIFCRWPCVPVWGRGSPSLSYPATPARIALSIFFGFLHPLFSPPPPLYFFLLAACFASPTHP